MSLIVNNVISSSSRINYNYLEGNNIFGYDVICDYTIDFSDVSFTDGSSILWLGQEAIKQAYIQQNIVARIGGDEFINGKITKISFESSSMVGSSSAQITIEESKRLDDYTNNQFAQNIPSPQWLSSFQENSNFSRTEGSYTYSRNVSIQYKQDAGGQFLNNARSFLRNFYFTLRPNHGFQTDGISENARLTSGFKPIISETYDLIGLSVSIGENLDTSFIEGNISRRQSYNIALLENGFTEKKYTVEIKALREPLEVVANNACSEIIDSIISENTQYGQPFSIEKGINKDGGIISLNISFTNDPSRSNSENLTYSISKSNAGIYFEYSVSLIFWAKGKNELEKFENTKVFWKDSNYVDSIKEKIQGLFPNAGNNLYEKSFSVSFEKYNAKIQQECVWTTDPSYNTEVLPDGVLKQKTSTSNRMPVERTTIEYDPVSQAEVAFKGPSVTLGEVSLNIEVVAKKSKGFWFAYDYLNGLGITLDGHINSDVISLDVGAGTANRVISKTTTQ